MGLDLFVMPLWRYFAGRFDEPVDATGAKGAESDDSQLLARERVARLRTGLEERLDDSLEWSDEGAVALNLQYSYPALQSLRAFAAYQDHPFPRSPEGGRPLHFEVDASSPEEHPSLLCVYHLFSPTRFPHLIDHSDCDGFYLPCDFPVPLRCFEVLEGEGPGGGATPEEVQEIEDSIREAQGEEMAELFRSLIGGDGTEGRTRERIESLRRETGYAPKKPAPAPKAPPGKHVRDWYKVGSSVRLLSELGELGRLLGMTGDWGDLKSGENLVAENDPLGAVKFGWGVLHYAARISVERRLPIVFNG